MNNIERAIELTRRLEEGTILLQRTSDAIELDLQGNSRAVNPHIEHWLIQEISSKNYVLYNLDTQRVWKIEKDKMACYLLESKTFGIKPMFTISEEVA